MPDSKIAMVLPLVALRGLTVFPDMMIHFDVGREKSVAALEEAMVGNQLICVAAQKDVKIKDPGQDDIYSVGTVGRIKQIIKLPGMNIRLMMEGLYRVRIVELTKQEPYLEALVEKDATVYETTAETEAYARSAVTLLKEYAKINGKISSETLGVISDVKDPGSLADLIATNVLSSYTEKQEILELFDPKVRLEKLIEILNHLIEVVKIEQQINQKVKQQIDKVQREYYLNEQLRAIQSELGDKDIGGEVEELQARLDKTPVSDEARQKAEKELSRMKKMTAGTPETSVIRSYVEWILDLPWGVETQDNQDLTRAQQILEEDHYGLEKVKERVLEYLAVCNLTGAMKGPILCFVGPPGVGKTSIAKSIARALDRKFVRMSLGGVRDEAEIRGHRRTYIGAIPGNIISSIKQAGTCNPVFLLDEIDKMASDFRGDPSSALLEVLDPEQNSDFRDHYMEMAFDLSRVMFIATANTTDTIPQPLLDRMEVIRIAGYTPDEKRAIAKRYLYPKQLAAHGLKKSNFTITDDGYDTLIESYTREAGVRTLERTIAAACRKAAREVAQYGKKKITLTPRTAQKMLGPAMYHRTPPDTAGQSGIATGLAWTALGGETLMVEVAVVPGSGKLELTGQLGDVMKESAHAAVTLVRAHAQQWGVDPDFYKKLDMHIHVPEGAIPKDGPSAGVTMTTAIVSALTGIAVRSDVAMTGEITLRGRVLPIGGLKEKSLAAYREGISTVIIPSDNRRDLVDVPDNVREHIHYVPANSIEKVLETALSAPLRPRSVQEHDEEKQA